MTELDRLVTTFAKHYQATLLTQAGVLAALGAACVGVLAWRLSAWPAASAWALGAPAVAGIVGAAALGWWLRRAWMPRQKAAAFLDERFGLQQRLITAEEFAQAESQPALYPLLVEDAMQRCADQHAALPRRTTPISAALAALLLLLLFWPLGGTSIVQLARRDHPSRETPPEPSPDQPQQSGADAQEQQQASAEGGESSSGGSQQQQQSSGGGGQSPQGQSQRGQGGQQQPRGGSGEQQPQQGGSQSAQDQQRQQDGSGAQQQARDGAPQPGDQQEGSSSPDAQSSQGGKQQASGDAQQGQGQRQQQAQGAQQGQAQQQQAAGRQQAQGSDSEGSRGSQRRSGSGQQQAAAQRDGSGRGGAGLGNQQELKAEIQQLLKEVSGELKELKQELAAAQGEPPPRPGTNTDPNLYDAPEQLDDLQGSSLPVQLQTDRAPASAKRPGAGTGKPGDEVLQAAPTSQREAAELSAQPTEETPMSRESIPPDYREVLDQLRNTPPPPNETRP
ncbi:MAG: hypothetical protein COV75_05125 [Candidatus Omnitrophica bacterium CG11_big_fil_rev_8_21_14_0_20_63_9]|nr:MAG: hypothetical protein COV75_05125 [Candidatus Omnitrophica bacterium CG11_big_fil_rev_8_21_14_0_20_63_9]